MSAKFYFYPMPIANHLVTIDLGEDLAELYSDWEYTSDTSQSMNGKINNTTSLNREVITIVRDRMSGGEDLFIKLQALQSHLDRGYSIAFSADSANAYCYPLSVNPVGGDTSLKCFSNPFRNMLGSATPSQNDYVVIESQPPAGIYEAHKVASVTGAFSPTIGGTVNTTNPVCFTYRNVVMMRHYRTWPILKRLPQDIGKNIVTNEHAISFSLELRLTPDYENLFAFHPQQENDPRFNGLLADGVVVGNAEIFEQPSVNLDNPPQQSNFEANFDIGENLVWNNWRNWGN